MDLTTMNDASFNLSDDFFDALSVIATTNPDFADIQQQQQPNPQMTTQCLIEEQRQRALQFTPQQLQLSPQLRQINFQQQQQQQMFRQQQQQQMIQQVGYQQQCQRQLAPQQQFMIQQQQQILAAYQQQQQQQHRSSTPAQNQHLNFIPQQQQQTAAQQRLFSQQQLQHQRPAAAQLQNEQSHALQLASQLQYQQTQNKQLPSASHVRDQQNRHSTMQYQQTQAHNQQSRVVRLASQLQIEQQSVHQIQNNQPQVQNQNLKQTIQNQQLPVPQLQQQPNVDVIPPQIQVQLQNKQATQVQQSMPQQQPIQLTIAQQRLVAARQQQQQQQHQQQQKPQNLAPKHRQTADSQNTFPAVSEKPQDVQTSNTTTTSAATASERVAPHIEIVEQPAPRASRFRYNCEVRDSGSIPGVNSTLNTKTFPTIRVVGYNGNAMVVVSCVTKDPPYRPHPHNLVGRSWCKNGICKVSLTSNRMSVTFDKLGIQCIKRKDFPASLEQREREQVDPFGTGFAHKEKDKLGTIDQNCVRLAFQAFLEGPKKGEFKVPLPAVVSDPIHDKKNSPDLTIYKMSHCSAPAVGDLEMILLCDRVVKEDIRVRFYEEHDEEVVWEESVDVSQTGAVHKYVAIVFRSPKYHKYDFFGTIQAKVELVRPSDGMYSNSLPFDFTPENEPIAMQRKRKRLHESLVARDLEAASTYSDQWNSMSHFNIIEAR